MDDSPPASQSQDAGRWVDFATLVKDVKAQMRALGYFPSAGGVLENLTSSMMQGCYGTPAKMAKMVGASMAFQDTSPPGKPGEAARYRLDVEGRAPIVFENLQGFNDWTRENSPTLMAWAERARVASAIPAVTTSSPRRRKSKAL